MAWGDCEKHLGMARRALSKLKGTFCKTELTCRSSVDSLEKGWTPAQVLKQGARADATRPFAGY
jgi:hypothetical protein